MFNQEQLSFDPGLVLLALGPVFLLCILAEAGYWRRRNRAIYSTRDVLSNAGLALLHQASEALFLWLLVHSVYAWLYQHGLRLITFSGWTFALLLLLQDLLYYGFHRASHRVRWLWASHVTHHSSERLNLSTALRQSLTYPLSGMWVFWLPLAIIGFPPDWVILAVGLNLAFQFFVHTELTGPLPRLSRWINTPSLHRVHHARNPAYLDCNYAGVLAIWDRLFGSFVAETERPQYGIVHRIHSHNPLTLSFHEWRAMLRDTWVERDLRYLVKPPGWRRPGAVSAEVQATNSP